MNSKFNNKNQASGEKKTKNKNKSDSQFPLQSDNML